MFRLVLSGLNERQSSAWSEAKACLSHVRGNLFFNMPRAAINKVLTADPCRILLRGVI